MDGTTGAGEDLATVGAGITTPGDGTVGTIGDGADITAPGDGTIGTTGDGADITTLGDGTVGTTGVGEDMATDGADTTATGMPTTIGTMRATQAEGAITMPTPLPATIIHGTVPCAVGQTSTLRVPPQDIGARAHDHRPLRKGVLPQEAQDPIAMVQHPEEQWV